jgi:hypothetical protein
MTNSPRCYTPKKSDAELLAVAARASFQPENGSALLTGRDCAGDLAPGVTFEVKPTLSTTRLAYFSNSLPSPDIDETQGSGTAVVLNLSPGIIAVKYRRKSDGAFIGETAFTVRPNTLSFIGLSPSPL